MKCTNSHRLLLLAALFIQILLTTSCQKDISNVRITATSPKDAPIFPYVFDWEGSTYLPTNPANIVSMPWIGSVGGLSGDMVSDYKSSDGWVLVYNTFNPTVSPYLGQTPPGGLYFALYNKYRGLLRFYLYIPSGTATPTATIAHGLSLYPAGSTASSMLNFDAVDVIDLATNKTGFTKTNNQQINLLGNWVVTQYEIEYDPTVASSSYPSLGLSWNSQAINVTSISLNGTQSGTITGSVGTSSGGFNPGSLFTGVSQAGLQLYGKSAVDGLIGSLPTGASPQRTYLTGLQTSLSNLAAGNLAGAIGGVFNLVFGGGSVSPTPVNLVMNTQIDLSGNLTNSVGLTNPFLVLPGQSNSQTANGPVPNYNNIMGVVNVSAKPVVNLTSSSMGVYPNFCGYPGWSSPVGANRIKLNFALNNSSFNVTFNPAVTSIATISAVTKTLYIYDINPQYLATVSGTPTTDGSPVTVGNKQGYRNPTYLLLGPLGFPCGYTGPITNLFKAALQISFDVTPFNGAPKTTIVKTFDVTCQ